MTNAFTKSEFWDGRYRDDAYIYGTEPNDFLRSQKQLFKSGSAVLSLAEGEGRNAAFLAAAGCAVHGVDFSDEARKKALQLAQQKGVSIGYDVADLTSYDMGTGAWDAVVSIFCHLASGDRPALFKNIRKGLKAGGIFVLEAYNPAQLERDTGGPKDSTYLIPLAELQAAFADFEILLARETVRDVTEGTHHRGAGAITQFVARKPIAA